MLNKLKKLYGSYAAIARALGVSRQAVSDWKRKKKIPPQRQLDLIRKYPGMFR